MSSQLFEDPWRAVCPNGHNSWEPTADGTYYCSVCGPFEGLHDVAAVGRDPNPMHR